MNAPFNASIATPLLSVDGVTLQYKTPDAVVTATRRVSFDVYPSDRFVLLGPSGCGKSTLLKAIGGYLSPVEGRITPQRPRGNRAGARPDDGVPGVRPAPALEDGARECRPSR